VDNLKRIFGLVEDGKRIYRIYEENEVQREEFAYCQLMHEIVFGDKGFVQTLGPTWELIHDPRFTAIENQFIVNRHAIFGGDARLGKQYINDDGTFSSSVADLEQYAEILGEGRNFHNVLAHPDELCAVRRWLERIYHGYTLVKPHLSLRCICNKADKRDPSAFKDADSGEIWKLLGQECPNRAFTKAGAPTAYGNLMFGLIRADLVGLVHDYAETPLIDSYIYLHDSGVVVSAADVQKLDPHGVDHQRVLQEIDILEQALTHRATLRVTAAKVLKNMQVEEQLQKLREPDGNLLQLTDMERDELLRIVYTSKWPDEKLSLVTALFGFLAGRAKHPFAQRESRQLQDAKARSAAVIAGLKDGSVQPINHYTEPTLEIPADLQEGDVMQYAAMLDSLTKNPFKGLLFQVYVAAEQEGEHGALDVLSPIFDPNYDLDEAAYHNFLRAVTHRVRSLRAMDAAEVLPRGTSATLPQQGVQQFEGEFHGKDSMKRN
jgi:hypothetical protein